VLALAKRKREPNQGETKNGINPMNESIEERLSHRPITCVKPVPAAIWWLSLLVSPVSIRLWIIASCKLHQIFAAIRYQKSSDIRKAM
jgi:hypothetical protein